MTPNNGLERTVDYCRPHPGCQQVVGWLCMRQAASWSAAQRELYATYESIPTYVEVRNEYPVLDQNARGLPGLRNRCLRKWHGRAHPVLNSPHVGHLISGHANSDCRLLSGWPVLGRRYLATDWEVAFVAAWQE